MSGIPLPESSFMASLHAAAWTALVVWLVIDCVIVGRIGLPGARQRDRLSNIVIGVAVVAGIAGAAWFAARGPGGMGRLTVPVQLTGLTLFCVGLVVRVTAIRQLGVFHAPLVAIQHDHRLVRHGLYRHVRHPSYLGACLAFAGFGLGLGNWLSAVTMVACCMAGYLYRIAVEETALRQRFGSEYDAYRRQTCRMLPGIF